MTSPRFVVPEHTDEDETRIQAGIDADPDNPELTDEELRAMRPVSEVLPPDIYAALVHRGGRLKSEHRKVLLTLRLDPQVLDAYKSTGPGWQTRMHDILAKSAPKP